MFRTRMWWVAAAATALSACDSSPTSPADTADEGALAVQALATVVESQWARLPSLDVIEDGARALDPSPGTASGSMPMTGTFGEADAIRSLAMEARRAGDDALVTEYESAADDAVMEALVVQLGPGVVVSALAGVEAVFAGMESAIEGMPTSAQVDRAMGGIRALLGDARTDLAAGRTAAALGAGLRAADEVRDLSPEQHARAAIARAKVWLKRATEAAGPDPADDIARALKRAREMLAVAERAFDAGAYRAAVRAARASIAYSRWVLRQLYDPPTQDQLKARAQTLIRSGGGWLARAIEAAGPNPGEDILRALRLAEEQLELSVRAFEAGEYKVAIRHAAETIAIARRVLRAFG